MVKESGITKEYCYIATAGQLTQKHAYKVIRICIHYVYTNNCRSDLTGGKKFEHQLFQSQTIKSPLLKYLTENEI